MAHWRRWLGLRWGKVVGKLEDGNASDKTINHRLLSEVSGHMHKHGVGEDAFIYIADSAMVTEANLAQAGERTRFRRLTGNLIPDCAGFLLVF